MKRLLKCSRCSLYTLKPLCPSCQAPTLPPLPPKFSLLDKYGEYRRKQKLLELKEKS